MGNRIFRSGRQRDYLTNSIDLKLSEIDQLIDNTIHRRQQYRSTYNSISRAVVIWGFIILFVIALTTYILHDAHAKFNKKIQHIIPFILSVVLLSVLNRLVTLYYNRKLSAADKYITELEQRRDEFVEQLMDATDFKRIASVIEQHNKKKLLQSNTKQQPNTAQKPTQQNVQPTQTPQTNKQQHNKSQHSISTPAPDTLSLSSTTTDTNSSSSSSSSSNDATSSTSDWNDVDQRAFQRVDIITAAGISHRSNTDKLIDFVLGDGPNNRYALICTQCGTHNGLVRDENINIKFRCVYCHHINSKYNASPNKTLIDTTNKLQAVLNTVEKQHNNQLINSAQSIPSTTSAQSNYIDQSLLTSASSHTTNAKVHDTSESATSTEHDSIIHRRKSKKRQS